MSDRLLLRAWSTHNANRPLSDGVVAQSPFDPPANRGRAFPFRHLSGLIDACTWPAPAGEGQLRTLPRLPDRASFRHVDKQVQGITTDRQSWFVSHNGGIHRYPIGYDLTQPPNDTVTSVALPDDLVAAGYDHLGDIDCWGEWILGALEGQSAGLPALVLAWPRDLSGPPLRLALGAIGASGEPGRQTLNCPWCAVHPQSGLLYSSTFDTRTLCVYRHELATGSDAIEFLGTLTLCGADGSPLPDDAPIRAVQGGAFSARGHLYLVSNVVGEGVLAFDVATGALVGRTPVALTPKVTVPMPGVPRSAGEGVLAFLTGGVSELVIEGNQGPRTFEIEWDELEGIAIADLSDGRAPGMGGMVHVVLSAPSIEPSEIVGRLLSGKPPMPNSLSLLHFDVAEIAERESL
ncbi:MAG: hypothetical protein ABI193_09580 [Minicystis sp.]